MRQRVKVTAVKVTVAAGKAVFHAEYVPPGQLDAVCAVTQPLGLSTLLKNIELDAYQLLCP